jgi:uncharacterized RDD family membrane protein YckC
MGALTPSGADKAKDYNPYQPPADPNEAPAPPSSGRPHALASHGQRFVAAMIDALIVWAIVWPAWRAFGVQARFAQLPGLAKVAGAGVNFVAYCAVQGFFLVKSSQTLGKRAMKIRIVRTADGRPAPAARVLLVRQLPQYAVAIIPVVGPLLGLLDYCLIFRESHRCLHDDIAGTEVRRMD